MDAQEKDTFSLNRRRADPTAHAQQYAHRPGTKNNRGHDKDLHPSVFEQPLWEKGYTRVAGIDEAGRGPLAGPVVASAVVFPVHACIPGVRDSKSVSATKREALYDVIVREALSVGIGVVDHREIDRINILAATYKAMRMAIGALSMRPHYLLVDGRAIPDCPIQQQALIGGDDRCFSIAAASIVAKVSRDRIMIAYDRQFPEYGFARHKGYATSAHRAALEKYGPCLLHRRSFSWKRKD